MKDIIIGGLISICSIILGALLTYFFSIKAARVEKNEKHMLELYELMIKLRRSYDLFCMYEHDYNTDETRKNKLINYDRELVSLTDQISKVLLLVQDKELIGEIVDVLHSIDREKYPTCEQRRIRIFELTDLCERRINKIYNISLQNTYSNNRRRATSSNEYWNLEMKEEVSPVPGHPSIIAMDLSFLDEKDDESSNVL